MTQRSEPRIGFVLSDARGTPLVQRAPHRSFYAASTMKLAVLLAVGSASAQGRLPLDRTLPASRMFLGRNGRMFTLEGSRVDPEFPPDGTPLRVEDLCLAMISRSSNEATNMLLTDIGWDEVNAVVRDLALRETRVDRLIGDTAAESAGFTNVTSPRDLSRLIRAVATGEICPGERLPEPIRRLFIASLEAQRTAPIGHTVKSGTRWGSKSGEVPGYRHDAAFIGDPETPSCRYLSICTSRMSMPAADEAIAALVAALGL